MILSLILLVLVVLVAYFHSLQGLFSATISAILAVIAAVVAVGYHEQAAGMLLGTKFAEQAPAIAMLVLFAVVYCVLRLAFDYLIPGNVRVAPLADKIGGAAMGLIAGLMATGVVAIAAQTLPFGPDVGYYARYSVSDRTANGQQQDYPIYDSTDSPTLSPDTEEHLWLHQDDLVMALAYKVSDGGSLAGDVALSATHPDYLSELFGQRIGIQIGANRIVPPAGQQQAVSVDKVYTQPQLTQIDSEPTYLRGPNDTAPDNPLKPGDPTTQTILIVRATISPANGVADSDHNFRFSPGSVRLVLGRPDAGIDFTDYHPVAILDRKGLALANRVDDFLIASMQGSRTIDFVFLVDNDHAFSAALDPDLLDPANKKGGIPLPPGSFLEIKRYGLVDLSGKKVFYGPPPNRDKTGVLRKPEIARLVQAQEPLPLAGVPAATRPTPNTTMNDVPLVFQDISVLDQLSDPIDTHSKTPLPSGQLINATLGVNGTWQQGKWTRLEVTPTAPAEVLALPGTSLIDQLAPMEEHDIVQVHCTLPDAPSAKKAWDWLKLVPTFALADKEDQTYKLCGAWVRFTVKGKTYFMAEYDQNAQPQPLPVPPNSGKVTNIEVWLAFGVPDGTVVQELRSSGNTQLDNLDLKVAPPPPPATQPASSPPSQNTTE
jgi:hypothetical protein